MMTGVGVALALVMLQGIIATEADDDFDNPYRGTGFFYEPYPPVLSLAPYFGFYRALYVIGSGNDYGAVMVALALTMVQAIVFLTAGTVVYVALSPFSHRSITLHVHYHRRHCRHVVTASS